MGKGVGLREVLTKEKDPIDLEKWTKTTNRHKQKNLDSDKTVIFFNTGHGKLMPALPEIVLFYFFYL